MLGNFSYKNATKLYFGDESLQYLNDELPKYGDTVQLIYGGGSVKKNGIYDAVVDILKANGKTIVSASAGSSTKSALKDVQDALFYMGVPEITRYGLAVQAMNWQGVPDRKKARIMEMMVT